MTAWTKSENPTLIPTLERIATLQGYGALLGLFLAICGTAMLLAFHPGSALFPAMIVVGLAAAGLALWNRFRFRRAADRLRARGTD